MLKSLNLSRQQGTPVLENCGTAAGKSKPNLPLSSKAIRQIKACWWMREHSLTTLRSTWIPQTESVAILAIPWFGTDSSESF
jgi:hypothetical protein